MNAALLLAIVCQPIWTDGKILADSELIRSVSSVNQWSQFDVLTLMQGRISLRSGPGGGVTLTPAPAPPRRSYDHRSQPLFGSPTGYAVRRSRPRSAPSPLITSRQVARETVRAGAFGGRGWRF